MAKFALISFLSIFSTNNLVLSHGAASIPPSRQYLCSGGASPNAGVQWNGAQGPNICSPSYHNQQGNGDINTVVTDWSGVGLGNAKGQRNKESYKKDPRQNHVNAMGGLDSPICSANIDKYSALDNSDWAKTEINENYDGKSTIPESYQQRNSITSYPYKMTTGWSTFQFKSSAVHKTVSNGYVDCYLTKKNVSPKNKVLTWNDLEDQPFCRFNSDHGHPKPMTDFRKNVNEWDCYIPEDRAGDAAVVFMVWQRHDSDEAFYGCSDVIFDNN